MRYRCEQGHRIHLQRQRPPCYKEILSSLLFLWSLDNGQSGAHSTSCFGVIVQSEDLSAPVLVCLAKCPCVFVPEELVVS